MLIVFLLLLLDATIKSMRQNKYGKINRNTAESKAMFALTLRKGSFVWSHCSLGLWLDRYPYLDMVRGFYHCLQVEPGIITDLAGTPFPGLRGGGVRESIEERSSFGNIFNFRRFM